MPASLLNISQLAILEESRQSRAVAAYADISEPLAGGLICFAGPGAHCNRGVALGMSGPVTGPEIDHLIHFYRPQFAQLRVIDSKTLRESVPDGSLPQADSLELL